MNKKIKLDDLVSISLTPATTADPNGPLKMIKASSIENGTINFDLLEKGDLKSKRDANKYFLKKDDIIFQARGNKFEAILIDKAYESLISTQIYFNLRIKNEYLNIINPVYLCWFLNNRLSQSEFSSKSSGSVLSSVPKKVLSELEILVPFLDYQSEIAAAIISLEKEKSTTISYLEKKEILLNETIIEKIGGNK